MVVGCCSGRKMVTNILEAKRTSKRVIVVCVTVGKWVLNVISAYAPQVALSEIRPNDCLLKVSDETSCTTKGRPRHSETWR
jgi:hypothetical protein